MTPRPFSWELFQQAPIVGIIRNLPRTTVETLLPLYREAGLTTIEITMNTPDAEGIIQYALDHYRTGGGTAPRPADGLNIGAGTVCTVADLDRALAAGAQFIVTPVLNKRVIRTCVRRGVPIMPGAFTPSEIYEAWALGASLVKVFPCTSLGPGYVRDVKAPLNQIKLLPTGGVSLANMVSFFEAGADGLGIGSELFDKKLIQSQDWSGLTAHFRKYLERLPTNVKNSDAQP